MSTNTNASSGASNNGKTGNKKELKVSEVREEEITRHIKNFTGNETTIVVADCAITEFTDNIKESDAAAGSNVLVDNKGKINPSELEKGNAVTILVRDFDKGEKDKDGKAKKDKKEEAAKEEENTRDE